MSRRCCTEAGSALHPSDDVAEPVGLIESLRTGGEVSVAIIYDQGAEIFKYGSKGVKYFQAQIFAIN
jgi:hypothetical protein